MAEDLIEREIVIEASPDRVWTVLTQPEHVTRWFGDSAQIDLRPGGRAAFGWSSDGGAYRASIEQVQPPSVLSYRWARETDSDPGAGNSTLVEFTLAEVPLGTLLRVTESGFTTLAIDDADRAAAILENTADWTRELADLKEYAEHPGA